MTFDPNTFPVAETADNRVRYAEGNRVVIPDGTTCLIKYGRVTRLNPGKPGGVMLVTVEADDGKDD